MTCRYQSLTHFALSRLVFEDILVAKLKNKCPPSVPVKEEQPKFEGDQENVLQYVAGYVPFKLQQKYMKRDAKEAAAVVNCLLAYTTEWTKAINRGGLFEVGDATYTSFRPWRCL